MTDQQNAYPLQWPSWKPRTPANERKDSRFGKQNQNGWGRKPLTIAESVRRVIDAIEKFTSAGKPYRTSSVVISTNLRLRRSDGLPSPDHSTARNWRDVIGYFGSSLAELEAEYKKARSKAHPDKGGSIEAFYQVRQAYKLALKELGA